MTCWPLMSLRAKLDSKWHALALTILFRWLRRWALGLSSVVFKRFFWRRMLKFVLFLYLLAVNISLLYTSASVIGIDPTNDVSQFLIFRKVAWLFMIKNCTAIWANWKLTLQKLRKCTVLAHWTFHLLFDLVYKWKYYFQNFWNQTTIASGL